MTPAELGAYVAMRLERRSDPTLEAKFRSALQEAVARTRRRGLDVAEVQNEVWRRFADGAVEVPVDLESVPAFLVAVARNVVRAATRRPPAGPDGLDELVAEPGIDPERRIDANKLARRIEDVLASAARGNDELREVVTALLLRRPAAEGCSEDATPKERETFADRERHRRQRGRESLRVAHAEWLRARGNVEDELDTTFRALLAGRAKA